MVKTDNDLIVEKLCNFDANKRCSIFELKNIIVDHYANTIIHNKIEQMKHEQEYMRNNISTLLGKIITNVEQMPHFFIILPVKKTTYFEKCFCMGHKIVDFYFVCPITLKLGNAYRTSVAKKWFKKIAPILQFSLIVLKIAASMYGIPIPIPNFEIATKFIDKNYIQNKFSVLTKIMLNDKIDAMSKKLSDENENNNEIFQTLPQQFDLTDNHYLEIRKLIYYLEKPNGNYDHDAHHWKPINTGLIKVKSLKDQSIAWILNDEKIKKKFHLEGKKCFQDIPF
jgi:hypothetical protein